MAKTGFHVLQQDRLIEHPAREMSSKAQLVDARNTVSRTVSQHDNSRSIPQPGNLMYHNVAGPREYKRLLSQTFNDDGNVQYLVKWKPTWEDGAVLGQIEQALDVYMWQVAS